MCFYAGIFPGVFSRFFTALQIKHPRRKLRGIKTLPYIQEPQPKGCAYIIKYRSTYLCLFFYFLFVHVGANFSLRPLSTQQAAWNFTRALLKRFFKTHSLRQQHEHPEPQMLRLDIMCCR
jgi:hypothetical protein